MLSARDRLWASLALFPELRNAVLVRIKDEPRRGGNRKSTTFACFSLENMPPLSLYAWGKKKCFSRI